MKKAGIRSCRNRSFDTGYHKEYFVVIVHLLCCARLFVTPWTATHQVPLYSTTSWSLRKYMSIESVMVSTSSSAAPITFWFQSFPGLHLFQWLYISDGHNIGVSASVFPMNIQSYFPFGLNARISLQSKGFSRVFSSTTVKSISSLALRFLYSATLTSINEYWKTIVFTIWTFVGKLISLLFNRLSSIVRAFLPSHKCLLISWLLSPSAVLLELKKRKFVTASTFTPSICHEVMRPDSIIFVFWMSSFVPAFSFSLLPVSSGSLVPLHFLPLEWYQLYFWGCWYFTSNLDYSLWFIQPGISHDVLCMEDK